MTQFGVRRGLVAATVLAMWVVPAFAQTRTAGTYTPHETQILRLGTSQRFSMPMKTIDDLHAMANKNRSQFNQVLSLAGVTDISGQVLDQLTAGNLTETMIQPGTHMEWMAMKRAGTPSIVKNVRWSGRTPFAAWQFDLTANNYTYTFLVPKVCGNLTLLSVVASPAGTISEAPAPPPPPEPTPEPPQIAVAPPPPPPPPVVYAPAHEYNPWVASGFVGSSFGTSVNSVNLVQDNLGVNNNINAGVTYGGQVGYLWHGIVGGEFLADFAPKVGFNSLVLSDNPHVNSYMGNLIAAFPFGSDGEFQPFVSGGVGSIGIRGNAFTLPDANGVISTESVHNNRWGSDIGGGMMVFGGKWGVRGDVRWFRASTNNNIDLNNTTPGLIVTENLLSDLHFWHGSLGVAFRW
jgi:hypothetical protein